jgi:hypothetical protein
VGSSIELIVHFLALGIGGRTGWNGRNGIACSWSGDGRGKYLDALGWQTVSFPVLPRMIVSAGVKRS